MCTCLYLRAFTPIHLVAHLTRRVRHHFRGCHLRSPVMDSIDIPYFAKLRQAGTVILINMEFLNNHCQPEACSPSGCASALHRPSGCRHCGRTRLRNKLSDCDSDHIASSKSYRSSSTRSRYINLCAVVCLLLVVGGSAPATAAPTRRKMENILWGNPCDYDPGSKSAKYTPKLAKDVASQAKNAFEATSRYRDEFALKLHSYPSFDKLLPMWSSTEWLRNFTWFPAEGLPVEKVLNSPVSDQYLDTLMNRINELLPFMYKGLKMVVAGLYSISEEGLNDGILSDASMKQNITQSMHDVRAVLCLFNELVRSRNLEVMPLPDTEIPQLKNQDKLTYALLVYRDTLNYLEYLSQFFQKMYDIDSQKAE